MIRGCVLGLLAVGEWRPEWEVVFCRVMLLTKDAGIAVAIAVIHHILVLAVVSQIRAPRIHHVALVQVVVVDVALTLHHINHHQGIHCGVMVVLEEDC